MEISTRAAKKTNGDFVSILLINEEMYEWMVSGPALGPCKLYVLQEFSRYHERCLRGSTAQTFWMSFAAPCVAHGATCCGRMTDRSIVRIAPGGSIAATQQPAGPGVLYKIDAAGKLR